MGNIGEPRRQIEAPEPVPETVPEPVPEPVREPEKVPADGWEHIGHLFGRPECPVYARRLS